MTPPLRALAATLLVLAGFAAAAGEPRLSLAGGPPRAFGGTTVTRTFKVEGAGPCDLVWESRVFRGIVNRGTRKVDAPGNVTIEMELPQVCARVDLIQQVQLKRDGQMLAEGNFPLALFPADILSEFARATADMPPIGLCDPEKLLAPILDKAGIKYTLLKSDLQAQTLDSKLVLVGPNLPEMLGEPMGGVRELLRHGGTAVFMEQRSSQDISFGAQTQLEVVKRAAPAARMLVGEKHILLRDLLEGDLADWAGSGEVASHALVWPKCPGYQAWLAGGEGKDTLPLVAQYWGENGRVIMCQLDVARRLAHADEPVAQLVLRSLLAYARQVPVPAQGMEVRFAVPPAALADGKFNTARFVPQPRTADLRSAAGMLILVLPKGDERVPAPGFDLGGYLVAGGKLFVQSRFEPEFVEALNQLARSAWPDQPRLPAPKFAAAFVEDVKAVQIRHEKPLAWGIATEVLQQGLEDVENRRVLKTEPDVPGFAPLSDPAFLAEFKRAKSRLVLCALPVDQPENESQACLVRQILANMTLEEDKDAR